MFDFFIDPDTTYEEDMQILRVIEAYCSTNKRQTQAVSGEQTVIARCLTR